MNIDIRNVPSYWMTCDKSIGERQDGFVEMQKSIGMNSEKMSGAITKNYCIGVAEEYIKALTKNPVPFLILEDDARVNPNLVDFPYTYDVDEDVDALYIGTSIVGRINKKTVIGVAAQDRGDYFQIYNMLSFHAVIYTSQEYVDNCVKILEEYIVNPVGSCDDPLAEDMSRWKVMAVKTPVFYQNDGRNEGMTLTPLTETGIKRENTYFGPPL